MPAGFWERAEALQALERLDMAQIVVLLRRHSALTQEALAHLTGLSKSMVALLDTRRSQLNDITKIRAALDALNAPKLRAEPRPTANGTAQGYRGAALHLPSSDLLEPLSTKGGRRVGANGVEVLRSRVHALRLADDLLAGKDLIVPARRELDAAVSLYRESVHTDDVGRALLAGIGELAQIAGWILSDAGAHAEAERVYWLGLSAARQAVDATLAANLAGSLAYQWTNTGRERDGLDLAEAAVAEAGPHAHPTARALFLDRLAWARAHTGDAHGAVRALGEAHDALTTPASQEGPAWAYWVSQEELEVMDARVYTELHRPLRAVPVLSAVLERYDATHTREFALYLSWLAVALAEANEPEHAAETATRMLAVAADVASDRTEQRTRVVLRRLTRFRGVPEVDEWFASLPVDLRPSQDTPAEQPRGKSPAP